MAVTLAPEMADPDLSKTVPERLPVAWAYNIGEMQSENAHTITRRKILFLIVNTPFGNLRWCD